MMATATPCCPRCGMSLSDPRHVVVTDGCQAHTEHGEDDTYLAGYAAEQARLHAKGE